MPYSPSSIIAGLPADMRVRLQYPQTTGKTVDAGRASIPTELAITLYGEDAQKIHSYYVDSATLGATPETGTPIVISGTVYVVRAINTYHGTLLRVDCGQTEY